MYLSLNKNLRNKRINWVVLPSLFCHFGRTPSVKNLRIRSRQVTNYVLSFQLETKQNLFLKSASAYNTLDCIPKSKFNRATHQSRLSIRSTSVTPGAISRHMSMRRPYASLKKTTYVQNLASSQQFPVPDEVIKSIQYFCFPG